MQITLPYDVLLLLEQKLGKAEAQTVGKAIEASLSFIQTRAEEVAVQKKLELREELSKELSSKGDIELLKKDLALVEQKLESKIDKVEMHLNSRIDKLDIKLNFLIVLMIIALILMNPVVADIIKNWMK